MIRSKYYDKSFIPSLITEAFLTFVVTTMVVFGICIFAPMILASGRARRYHDEETRKLFGEMAAIGFMNADTIIVICLILGAFCAYITLLFRKMDYIVSLEIDHQMKKINFVSRNLKSDSHACFTVGFDQLVMEKVKTTGFLFITRYHGYLLWQNKKQIGYFLYDHLTWDTQKTAYRDTIETLKDIKNQENEKRAIGNRKS
ncbi:MAG: hypothetical protein AB1458_09585 [Bacteroidota bacterium]